MARCYDSELQQAVDEMGGKGVPERRIYQECIAAGYETRAVDKALAASSVTSVTMPAQQTASSVASLTRRGQGTMIHLEDTPPPPEITGFRQILEEVVGVIRNPLRLF